MLRYSAVKGFWSVEDLSYGLTDCGEVARGGCLVPGNLSVKTSTLLTESQRRADQI